jgi:hypothetical protein
MAAGVNPSATALATGEIGQSQANDTDLKSTAKCVESALARVVFTAREIEGDLALDDPSWRSIGGHNR